jgi:DNA modification methylase
MDTDLIMAKNNNQKLELTWIGKGHEPKLEPRILIEQPEYSYGDPNTGNMLIQGDNLLALKALEQEYAGKVKCIYIDPPYNTGNAFEHYDDGIEHSQWLNLMAPRLKLLKSLLRVDGVLFVNIDEKEHAYPSILSFVIFEGSINRRISTKPVARSTKSTAPPPKARTNFATDACCAEPFCAISASIEKCPDSFFADRKVRPDIATDSNTQRR